MLKEYYRLGRPINALAGVLAVIVSAYAVGPLSWWPVIAAALSVLLITVSTNAWNDYLDIEIDRINKPGRPLPAGTISPQGALYFSIIGTALSLLIATFINLPAFLIALGANILLYLYSWKLKCTVLWGNITVALIVGLCFIFGGVAAGSTGPTLMLAATVFMAMMGREILKTMADYRGDLDQKCATISTVWGKVMARRYTIVFLALTVVFTLATYVVEKYNPVYLYLVIFGLFPILTYIAINAKSDASGQVLERNSTIMKYSFFVWFLAVVLGAG
jgi:geranylgeranylglycerol-phosphate geranylgeranyltransferase